MAELDNKKIKKSKKVTYERTDEVTSALLELLSQLKIKDINRFRIHCCKIELIQYLPTHFFPLRSEQFNDLEFLMQIVSKYMQQS